MDFFTFLEPGPVQHLLVNASSSNDLLLSWTPPYDEGCPQPTYFLQYYINYTLVGKGGCQSQLAVGQPDKHSKSTRWTTYNIDNLYPNSVYNISISVWNHLAGFSEHVHREGRTHQSGEIKSITLSHLTCFPHESLQEVSYNTLENVKFR